MCSIYGFAARMQDGLKHLSLSCHPVFTILPESLRPSAARGGDRLYAFDLADEPDRTRHYERKPQCGVSGGLQCQPQHGTYFVQFGFRFSRFPMRMIEPGDRAPGGGDLVLAFHEPVSWEPPIHPFFYSEEAGQRGGYLHPRVRGCSTDQILRMTRRGTSLAPSKCFTSIHWSARATCSRVPRCLARKKAILIEILKFGCSIMLSRVRKE
jgi:hypothetical protein